MASDLKITCVGAKADMHTYYARDLAQVQAYLLSQAGLWSPATIWSASRLGR
jgi:hypothetical protein